MLKDGERIDQLYSQNVQIIQSADVFSFSLDAVLLANFARIGKRDRRVVDLCAGNGAVGLFLTAKTQAQITMIEIQPKLADMAQRSVKLNQLADQVTVINADLKDSFNYLRKDSVDVITVNPPYFVNYNDSHKNPNPHLALARHELATNLESVVKTSSGLLKMNAKFFCVFRPDRLTDLLVTMRANRIEPKRIQFVRSHIGDNANMVLVEGIKDGKLNGVNVIADLIVYDGDQYSKSVKKMLYGEQ
ncbi:tRNA1(Val) (adenine(37)-N6)-methyltransferase [Lentilactobacillus senioris]|uniref:tRNA1(Val) (adenine(37)-N6)-methyltransferase n=1 Tax=Lentilactobacillus senioris TaxID=931534 RepID=UPI0022806771|nr:tRNA1(Val) (adenine(37)-N6)-methyltransferase [Lentilactobacillus senioris]MCY9806746.1 tRNA1(Val) (adenine(37)-N6)-methyltransferase [Lentilactobacillus senioris]